ARPGAVRPHPGGPAPRAHPPPAPRGRPPAGPAPGPPKSTPPPPTAAGTTGQRTLSAAQKPAAVLANLAASITVLVTGSSTAAVLLALCGSTAISTSSFMVISWPSGVSAGEESNATSGSADLS